VTVTRVRPTGGPSLSSRSCRCGWQPIRTRPIPIAYRPGSQGDDIGAVRCSRTCVPNPSMPHRRGRSSLATVADQWDHRSPRSNMHRPRQQRLDGPRTKATGAEPRIASEPIRDLPNATSTSPSTQTTTASIPFTRASSNAPVAPRGEAGRSFSVDNTRPRILTPARRGREECFLSLRPQPTWYCTRPRFLDPVLARAHGSPVSSAPNAPGAHCPTMGTPGSCATYASPLRCLSCEHDRTTERRGHPRRSRLRRGWRMCEAGALDPEFSFAGIVPATDCRPAGRGSRPGTRLAKHLNGHLKPSPAGNFGSMRNNSPALVDLL